MNVIQILNSKEYLNKDQFEKRKLLEEYILTDKDCKIGTNVLCFEKETIVSERNRYFYKQVGKHKCNVTIGKQYRILDHKESKIKIENDSGKKLWFSINRFLYYLKLERKEKLNKLKNESN